MNTALYGAIDIGSNAVRLLISTVYYDKNNIDYRKTSLIRFPIRLGEDVFINGKISKEKETKLIDAMGSYALALKTYGITEYYACATSAMRNASNGKEIIKNIKEKTGININIIDGKTEAKFISATNFTAFIKKNKNYLYVDVGGGSTEYTFYANGQAKDDNSFKLGTVRLLHKVEDPKHWEEAEKWIKKVTKGYKNVTLIGSGGNINTIFKASKTPSGQPMSKAYLQEYADTLNTMSFEERVMKLGFRKDRADVIIPATKIYLNSMDWAGANEILVPKIGLVDGIIKTLHTQNVK